MRCHLFCRVIDNYGDAGVAWRFARQLRDAGDAVTLFIDDLAVLERIEPRLAGDLACQDIDDIEVRAYDFHELGPPAEVVVSIFGSDLSDAYRLAMATAVPMPLWIDLEYLSAEDWVVEFHGLPSPDPQSTLVKHFFYPGFVDGTGGLGFEPDLATRRRVFVEDRTAIRVFADRLGLDLDDGSRRASLFAYPTAPFAALFEAIASGPERWTLLVPEGVADAAIETFFGRADVARGVDRALTVCVHPFLSQEDYVRLLWLCDAAFVRGEDSFVRAQCAGLPFVWQPYPQAEGTHDVKRAAFEALYEAGLVDEAKQAQRAMWRAWNQQEADVAAAWTAWQTQREALSAHAQAWSATLTSRSPLVTRLRDWVASRRADLLN